MTGRRGRLVGESLGVWLKERSTVTKIGCQTKSVEDIE